MKVAFHVDQLWFSAPGGIGTYVRELLPALAGERPVARARPVPVAWDASPPRGCSPRPPVVEVPAPIRSLYPRGTLLGRPALPPSLATCDVVHATNPAAVPPVGDDQRLVVTVHDLAFERFPERSRAIGAGSTGPGCAPR